MKGIKLIAALFLPVLTFAQELPDLKLDLFPEVFEEYKPMQTEGNEIGMIISIQSLNPATTTYYIRMKNGQPLSYKSVYRDFPWDAANEVVNEVQLTKEQTEALYAQLFKADKLDELLKFVMPDFNVSDDSECFILDGMGVNITVIQYNKVAHLYCYEPYFRYRGCPDDKTINRPAMKAFVEVMDEILKTLNIQPE